MTRDSIPKKIRDAVLDEYSHRCAICAGDHPHIHHIDENHNNNDSNNLLPLCPNCHLRDQHNPTRKIDISKLQLFRSYKDPAILKPQFHPIYERLRFLESIEPGSAPINELEKNANELIEFVQALEMGAFYGKRLTELVGPLRRAFLHRLDGLPDPEYERQRSKANQDYRDRLITKREAARTLLVEQLRYQQWANEA